MANKTKYKKVTFTLPEDVVNDLERQIPKGERSKFVYETLKEKITDNKLIAQDSHFDPVDDLFNYSNKLPKKNLNQILKSIERGRA